VIAGITYDPDYDLPERLYRYGADRGMVFDERCQLLRTTGSFAPIRDGLELAVGYGSATVNRHRIELLFVDPAGNVVAANLRRLWDERDALAALTAIQAGETGKARAAAGGCCG
jgi:cytochrome oxidase Cu insertion factor (SCO1/SenC/PrrC family)